MPDYEAQYNNSRRVPEWPAIAARWQRDSDACRRRAGAALDVPYGPGERHRYDLFPAREPQAPLVAYLHGGYWQEGDRRLYAFLARALVGAGVSVAIPSYSLCPAVPVTGIVDELRRFAVALWRRTERRPLVIGHSAGGHLTAALLATDWSAVPLPDGTAPPRDLVRAGVAISGVFELEPLVGTSINRALGLDREVARAASPAFWRPPRDRTIVAAVGGGESEEFRRQSRELAARWEAAGAHTEYLEIPGANHFTVIEELERAGSPLRERVLDLARELAA